MTRRKTFRKRRQKKIQKGGAVIQRDITLPDKQKLILTHFDDDEQTNYYGMIRKTRKNVTMSSQSTEQEPEYEINSYIVNENQKNEITQSKKLKDDDKLHYNDNAFKQFYESKIDSSVGVVEGNVAFFKLGATQSPIELKKLEINTINDIDWDNSI